tara:strand:+ start:284 stop:1294 length:1011 start_codon:yes stop_codon:yes gene_type:complete
MTVPFMKTGNTVSILAQGKWYQVKPEHPNYDVILEALHGSEEDIVKLIDVSSSLEDYLDGNVEVVGGSVKYDGDVVDNTLTRRIIEFMRQGLPFEPLVKLFENLMKNTSYQTRTQLYDFLEHKNLPITEDGCFLAYKAVSSDYKDKYSRTMDNSVGQSVGIDRGKVDDDRDRGCSSGLHCGALDYVRSYGSEGGGDHIMVVKVNPVDAVSVPHDCQYQKLRVCKYEVVSEMEWNDELRKPLYSADGQEYQSFVSEDYDDDWDDEELDEEVKALAESEEKESWISSEDASDVEDEIQDVIDNEPDAGKVEYFKKMAYNHSDTENGYLKKLKELLKGE